jgi:hypothetical protein
MVVYFNVLALDKKKIPQGGWKKKVGRGKFIGTKEKKEKKNYNNGNYYNGLN